MAKDKKKNPSKKANIKNKIYISYKQGMSSTRLTHLFLKFILIIISYNSISLTEEKVSTLRFLENFSNITMIIKSDADDYKQVFGNTFPYSPYSPYLDFEVFVNNKSGECTGKKCKLKSGINTITLKFKETIKSCHSMFYGVNSLLEIDFSEFDTSEVTNMTKMFMDCND